MKLMMSPFLVFACMAFAMEQPVIENIVAEVGVEVPSRVPSLRHLAFQVVQKNMRPLARKAERRSTIILDVIQAEEHTLDLFQKARLVDLFKLKDLLGPVVQELASYIDAHASAVERKKILRELDTLSIPMQRAIQLLREN